MITQISEKAGMKKLKQKVITVISEKFKQIERAAVEGNPFVIPINPDKLTGQPLRANIEAVNVNREKCDDLIKGACVQVIRSKGIYFEQQL